MDKETLTKRITEAMIEGGDGDSLDYVPEIVLRLMSKEPLEKQVEELLGNLRMGLGVQNAFILIECF